MSLTGLIPSRSIHHVTNPSAVRIAERAEHLDRDQASHRAQLVVDEDGGDVDLVAGALGEHPVRVVAADGVDGEQRPA